MERLKLIILKTKINIFQIKKAKLRAYFLALIGHIFPSGLSVRTTHVATTVRILVTILPFPTYLIEKCWPLGQK